MKEKYKKFLKLPEYPGGKEAFKKYIKENLRYPTKALENKIEGIVHLSARIDDNGEVVHVSINKGLGHGCDEEATRLIKNVHFGAVKNRGVRLKTTKRFKIEFKLPPQNRKVSYNLKSSKADEKDKKEPETGSKYSYIINT